MRRRSFSLQTESARECLAGCAITLAVPAALCVVAFSLPLSPLFWVALGSSSAFAALLVSRRVWLLVRRRGLEWTRLDEGCTVAQRLTHALAFVMLFTHGLTQR